MSKLAVIADVHAQRSAWANRPIEGDSEYALAQFAEICDRENVRAAVGLGDLKERPVTKSYDDGLWLNLLDDLYRYGVPFFYIQGNHDKANPPCLWNYPNAKHIHGEAIDLGDDVLYGIDYQEADSLRAALDAVPDDVTVLATHQRWSEFMGSATNPQGSLSDVRGRSLQVLASGDLHETVVKSFVGVDREFTFLSPGPPTMQSIVEDDDKYVFIIEDRIPRRVPLKSRRVIRSPMLIDRAMLDDFLRQLPKIVSDARVSAVASGMPDALQTPILQVRYDYRLDDTVRRVTKLVGDKAHLFWKEQAPDKSETDRKVVSVSRGEAVTPLGLLKHVVDPEKEPHAYNLLVRGLTANDKDDMKKKTEEFCTAFLEGRDVDQGD